MIFHKDLNRLKKDMEELPEEISRTNLIEWFLEKQKEKKPYCVGTTIAEIINVAYMCNIKVIR